MNIKVHHSVWIAIIRNWDCSGSIIIGIYRNTRELTLVFTSKYENETAPFRVKKIEGDFRTAIHVHKADLCKGASKYELIYKLPCFIGINDPMTNRIIQWIQRMDYRHGLPIMAKMPFFIGVFASYCRGLLQALTDYDWRSIALGRKYIRSQVYQAMTALTGGRPKNVKAVLGRFLHNSRSEYQDCLYMYEKKIEEVCRNSKVNGIEAYVKAQKSGRGIVLLTCHFDSFILGIVLLGKHGLKTNLLSSAVVEDFLVHPDVKTFFYQKYRRMEKFIGGKIIHFETGSGFLL